MSGQVRQSYRWRRAQDRAFLIGPWFRQSSNNSGALAEALPFGGTLIAVVELERPGPEVLGYRLHLYSDGQGWLFGVDSEKLSKGRAFKFDGFDFVAGWEDRIKAGARIQPTGDPQPLMQRSNPAGNPQLRIGHTNVSGFYTRTYTWYEAYPCIERFDPATGRWLEVPS